MTTIIIILLVVIIILIYLNHKKNILLHQEKNNIVQWHISKLWSDMHYHIIASTDDLRYTITENLVYKNKQILANLPISWKREIWESVVNKLKDEKRVYDSNSQKSVLLFEKIISEYKKYLRI